MTFVDTLLATLIGALFAAFAAWLFALDLHRRTSKDSARARLDAAVADVVRLLGSVGGAGQAFIFAAQLNSPAIQAPPPHLARHQLLSATLAAQMAAGNEDGPLRALYELVARRGDQPDEHTGLNYTHAAYILVEWRQGKISVADAQMQIVAGAQTPNS